MSTIKQILLTLLLLAPCSTLTGCFAFYSYEPVQFSVRDAETGAPIDRAHIEVRYLGNILIWNNPKPADTNTDSTGHAILLITDYQTQMYRVTAAGYKTAGKVSSVHAIPDFPIVFNMDRER